MTTEQEYEAQLQKMLKNGRQWLSEHPKTDIKIQWNFPRNVALIMPVSQAIEKHFVSANADGLELMKSLWQWNCPREPTVLMTRVVVENLVMNKVKQRGFNLIELLCVIGVLACLAAIIIPGVTREYRRAKARAVAAAMTNPPNHLIYKTNYLIISGVEDSYDQELPPDYAILTSSWGGFVFRDGDWLVHPFWADGGWETEEQAIRAAWLSHSRRLRERNGRLKPPDYLVVRTNQTRSK